MSIHPGLFFLRNHRFLPACAAMCEESVHQCPYGAAVTAAVGAGFSYRSRATKLRP